MILPPIPDLFLLCGLALLVFWLHKQGKLDSLFKSPPSPPPQPAPKPAPPPPPVAPVFVPPPPPPAVEPEDPVIVFDRYSLLNLPMSRLVEALREVEAVRAVLIAEIDKLKEPPKP